MTPNDYYKAAEKHLSCCLSWRDKTKEDAPKERELLEAYYLLGYVAECFTIYTVYRFGHWNPEGETSGSPKSRVCKAMKVDVEKYFDPVFTHHTHYDYFKLDDNTPSRTFCRQIKEVTKSRGKRSDDEYFEDFYIDNEYDHSIIWRKIVGGATFNKGKWSDTIIGGGINVGSWHGNYHTQGHKFQMVIENSICGKLCKEEGLNNSTFFDGYKDKKKDNDAFKLLDEWEPKIRYCSRIRQWEGLDKRHSSGIITRENLVLLMDVLEKLHKELDKYR